MKPSRGPRTRRLSTPRKPASKDDLEARSTTYFLLQAPAEPGSSVELAPEEAHHALRVLRLAAGAIVPATDGRGARYRLRLLPSGRRCAALVLEREVDPPRGPALEVGVGAGRRERFLWCVEKLTELEVARVTPLLTATVQSRSALAGEGGERLAGRARMRAAAAVKQSKGTWLPEVRAPEDLSAWASRPFEGLCLLLALPASRVRPLAEIVSAAPAQPAFRLAVGPEGGFVPEEEDALVESGFLPAHLGPRRLRFETAAVAAVCHVRAALAVEDACSS